MTKPEPEPEPEHEPEPEPEHEPEPEPEHEPEPEPEHEPEPEPELESESKDDGKISGKWTCYSFVSILSNNKTISNLCTVIINTYRAINRKYHSWL